MSKSVVGCLTSVSSCCFVNVPSEALPSAFLAKSQSGTTSSGALSRTGGGMAIVESNFVFDTRKLVLEVDSEPTIMRIRFEGLKSAGSMLGWMGRFEGVDGVEMELASGSGSRATGA